MNPDLQLENAQLRQQLAEATERASRYEKAARDSWSFARVALAVGRCDHGITV